MTEQDQVRAALHRLWTKAVGQPGYDKEEWKLLERLVEHLLATARGLP